MRLLRATLLVGLCAFTQVCGVMGCSSGPRVPKDAKLIWYGHAPFSLPKEDLPSGTLYLTEEGTGKTVSAVYRPAGQPIHFNGIKDGRNYRLYFVEGSMG